MDKRHILLACWKMLSSVRQVTFQSAINNGPAKGKVSVTKAQPHILVFKEKGIWKSQSGNETQFNNSIRWTLDCTCGVISLEHLRRGPNHPVFLFHLTPLNRSSLSSIEPYICGKDTYFGQVHFDKYSLRLSWRVIGPQKNEEIDYFYSASS